MRDNERLGLMLSSSAACALAYSTLGMAKVIKHVGVRKAMIGSAAVQMAMLLSLPRMQGAPFLLIIIVQATLQMANTTTFTCTIAAVNNVCSAYPDKRGAINGVSVTVESTAKALGPGLGGSLYAWAIAHDVPDGWPNASVLYFSGFATLVALFIVGATALPPSIDRAAVAAGSRSASTPATEASNKAAGSGSRRVRWLRTLRPGTPRRQYARVR